MFRKKLKSRSFPHTVHVVTRCRAPNPWLPQQQDTTPYAVKKSQSCAPEDGQKFARNMLSWSWRWINCYCCISLVFCITLPTLMMHGQAQIKFSMKYNNLIRCSSRDKLSPPKYTRVSLKQIKWPWSVCQQRPRNVETESKSFRERDVVKIGRVGVNILKNFKHNFYITLKKFKLAFNVESV